MLRRFLLCVSFLALGAFGSLQAQSNDTQSGTMSNQSSSQVSRADQNFATRACEINIAEIQMGQLASQRSTNNDVKQYAQQMVDDHTKANDQLKQVASSKGITCPTSLDQKDKTTLNRLRSASGNNFDREFVQDQMRAHKQAISLFQNCSNNCSDQDLKSWASNQLSGLQNHESMASNLYSQFSGRAPGAQGRSEYGNQPSSTSSSSSSSSSSQPSNQNPSDQNGQQSNSYSSSSSSSSSNTSNTTTSDQNNPTNQNQNLPRTASNMPLLGLVGLLLVGAALITRSFRLLRGTR